jgi:hypothetical protein
LAATRTDAKISKLAHHIQTAKNEIVSQIIATGVLPTAKLATAGKIGFDNYSNVITEMDALATPEVDDVATAIGGQAVVFKAENGAGGVTDCMTMDINASDMEIKGLASNTTQVCTAIKAMIPDVTVSVAGSRVTY